MYKQPLTLATRGWFWGAVKLVAVAPLLSLVHLGAYWLRFEGDWAGVDSAALVNMLACAIVLKLALLAWYGFHRNWSHFVTFHDLVTLFKATTISSVLLALVDYALFTSYTVPRSVFLMDWGFSLIAVGALRSLRRLLVERAMTVFRRCDKTPVLIVGTNHTGEALLRAIRTNPSLPYRVVGFISEENNTRQSSIAGVPIVGSFEQTSDLVRQLEVSEVLLAAGELSGKKVRQLMGDAQTLGITVKVLPSYEQLLGGDVDLRPRTVAIEDLLRRDPVQLDITELHRWIDGQTLLVTGSAGSIGSEICRQLLQFTPKKLIALDRAETCLFFLERELRQLAPHAEIQACIADINDSMRMNSVFKHFRPDIVFHAAAYKHVGLMESHVGEAVKNIALATRTVADLAHRHGVKSFVQISTDKAVNPTSVMGTCKRIAELYIQALADRSSCRFVTVRFGNVLDSAGSVVPIFRAQLNSGGPITVTHPDMTRFFMTIPEASQLVIQAGAMGQRGEIFVLDMGEPVRIADLAEDMIRLSGLQLGRDIEIEYVGVRPGEKLYEELHAEGERHLPTSHPKIFVTESEHREFAMIQHSLESLAQMLELDEGDLRNELARIVPEYRRQEETPAAMPKRLTA